VKIYSSTVLREKKNNLKKKSLIFVNYPSVSGEKRRKGRKKKEKKRILDHLIEMQQDHELAMPLKMQKRNLNARNRIVI
jgi:hypothetical protein